MGASFIGFIEQVLSKGNSSNQPGTCSPQTSTGEQYQNHPVLGELRKHRGDCQILSHALVSIS
jgi:hypothetical protein